jgi:hypothetical protein
MSPSPSLAPNAATSSPPHSPHSAHSHLDLLIEQQDARLDRRFEALKGDLTQWFGYMSNSNITQLEKGISDGFAELRGELAEDRLRVVAALDELTTMVKKTLQKIPSE